MSRDARARVRDDTRLKLVWAGTALLTEKSFAGTGIEEVLQAAGVPRGSFYHFFPSKEAFGVAVIDNYGAYFDRKLDRLLQDGALSPLARVARYVEEAARGIERFACTRGCLAGNLSQELGAHSDVFKPRLEAIFAGWERRIADCLREAIGEGALAAAVDPDTAAEMFWYGFEGALMRAKLDRSAEPLRRFGRYFLETLGRPAKPRSRSKRRAREVQP
jgi:TetR/AcrR family transcriptional repressor of nem operon